MLNILIAVPGSTVYAVENWTTVPYVLAPGMYGVVVAKPRDGRLFLCKSVHTGDDHVYDNQASVASAAKAVIAGATSL